MNKLQLQQSVIDAAIAICDNAAYFPDGNAQVLTEIVEALGEALSNLAEFEQIEYAPYLQGEQTGLNSVQVALLRTTMNADQLRTERLIDLADAMYLAFFDEVIVPGAIYRSVPMSEAKEVRYIPQSAIEEFIELN